MESQNDEKVAELTKEKPTGNNEQQSSNGTVHGDAVVGGDEKPVDDEPQREQWNSWFDFLLSCVGYAVGLGNVWRFPYLCYRNGGFAFMIPYTIMLVLVGMPLFFLELSYGQFSSLGTIAAWKLSPIFKGIGYSMFTVSFFVSITSDDPRIQNKACFLKENGRTDERINDTNKWFCNSKGDITQYTSPAEDYWNQEVLNRSPGVEEVGGLQWHLALCLLFSWIVVFLCIIKGVKLENHRFPYVMITVLLIRGVTLDGASRGLEFYMAKPDWSRLGDPQVWGDAASQIFYSLGVGWGGLITMGSYNRFHNNCQRDAILVSLINCGTSVYAGIAIFSLLGFMSYSYKVPVEDVAESGPGLAFIVYPEGLTQLEWGAPVWSACFFFMLFTLAKHSDFQHITVLGLDSQFVTIETIVTALVDEFPHKLRRIKVWFTLGICVFMYLIGLLCVTHAGIYYIQMIDSYLTKFGLLVIGLSENLIIFWVYGHRRFWEDLRCMLGRYPFLYWKLTLFVSAPFLIVGVIIFSIVKFEGFKYEDYYFPTAANVFIVIFMLIPILPIPCFAIGKIFIEAGGIKGLVELIRTRELWSLVRKLAQPAEDWGPALEGDRKKREEFGADLSLTQVHFHKYGNLDEPDTKNPFPDKRDMGVANISFESHL